MKESVFTNARSGREYFLFCTNYVLGTLKYNHLVLTATP